MKARAHYNGVTTVLTEIGCPGGFENLRVELSNPFSRVNGAVRAGLLPPELGTLPGYGNDPFTRAEPAALGRAEPVPKITAEELATRVDATHNQYISDRMERRAWAAGLLAQVRARALGLPEAPVERPGPRYLDPRTLAQYFQPSQ